MIVQMEKTPNSKSKERAQQLYNKNLELEKKRQKAQQARIPSDPNAWYQIRENYEAIILEDHAFSEQHNIEFALWQVHYKRIEEFRAHFSAAQAAGRLSSANSGRVPPQPDRITKIRVQFKAFLSEATGFYHDLILKIRAKYGLPLGHFSDDSDNQAIMGTDTAKSSDIKKGLVSCHRCLIYLGDLARYKGLYGEGESRSREYSAASSYYLQAASLWPSNGNPHHQLAILATYSSDDLVAIYRYFRSLAAEIPFSTAKDNLAITFEKNRQSYSQLLETTKPVGDKEVSMKEKYKGFCIQFVRLHGILFSRTSMETFAGLLTSVSAALCELLSSGPEEQSNFGTDGMENGLAILRLVAVLIFTVHNVNRKNEGQSYAEILQHTVLLENACTAAFELMSLIVERCLQLHDPSSSFLLPGILVFLEWLASCPDVAACTIDDKKLTAAKMSFWKHCIALFNWLLSSQLVSVDDEGDETCFTDMSRYEEGETDSRLALWEDFELRGFLPLLPAQSILNFSRKHSVIVGGSSKEKRTQMKRIISAGKALASVAKVDQQAVSFNSKLKQFVIGTQQQESVKTLQNSYSEPAESASTEQRIAVSSVNSIVMQDNVQLLFEGEDDDEEIVFKPTVVEKQVDSIGLTWISPQDHEQDERAPPVAIMPHQQVTSELIRPSDNIGPQRHPIMDVHNSGWSVEQQDSLADGIKKLKFVENGSTLTSEVKGAFGVFDSGSFFPAQSSVSFMDTPLYSDYRRAPEFMMPPKVESQVTGGLAVKPPPMISATSKSQVGRPIRHLGPPPGFSPVRPKNVSMPVSSIAGTKGSILVDDYSWLDGYQMPSSISSIGPNVGPPLGNMQFMSNGNNSNGNSGLPFPGMQAPSVQFQGGSIKGYPEYQSLRNLNPNHLHNLPEQQHAVGGNQFTSQSEHYQGQSAWTGPYRV